MELFKPVNWFLNNKMIFDIENPAIWRGFLFCLLYQSPFTTTFHFTTLQKRNLSLFNIMFFIHYSYSIPTSDRALVFRGRQLLVVCCWLSVVGCLLLVVGIIVVGHFEI